MISTPDRQNAIVLIDQAVTAGARRTQACAELGIDERTCRRWRALGIMPQDRRPTAPRPALGNKLSAKERQAVLDTCNSPAFESLPPSQIVPRLADDGRYLASEASFYRILRAADQQHHRGRTRPPVRRPPPASHRARGPCQVWTWDITWILSAKSGRCQRHRNMCALGERFGEHMSACPLTGGAALHRFSRINSYCQAAADFADSISPGCPARSEVGSSICT